MGKTRDGRVPILPSTTRRGTTLNTSVALDSPSVMSKLLTPPRTHPTSAESENSSDNFDDASTVLDDSGSLGPFLDATIAKAKQIENTEIPDKILLHMLVHLSIERILLMILMLLVLNLMMILLKNAKLLKVQVL